MYLSIQGNIGLGKAIDYFTSYQITVSIPLNDTQKYDLVADINGELKRISVKTSRYLKKNKYGVKLNRAGGTSRKTIPFDNSSCDYIFVLTGDNRIYLIPSKIITSKYTVIINEKYAQYEVFIKPFSTFINEISNL